MAEAKHLTSCAIRIATPHFKPFDCDCGASEVNAEMARLRGQLDAVRAALLEGGQSYQVRWRNALNSALAAAVLSDQEGKPNE